MKTIGVELGNRSYEVVVGEGALDQVAPSMEKYGVTGGVVIADGEAAGPWVERLNLNDFGLLEIPPGEPSKSMDSAQELLTRMVAMGLTRNHAVVTLGGGMVGDLGGFVASIYMRGLPLFHVPTTLLSQVDSCIGGKTGVNLTRGKNLVGTFHQPSGVFVDPSTLSTLPDREYRSGFAEVLKYGFVFGVGELGTALDPVPMLERQAEAIDEVVSRCLQIKADVITRDEFDRHGERVFLNYGHTLGHALEFSASLGPLKMLHGEAIGLGMIFAAELSAGLGMCSPDLATEHRRAVGSFGLPTEIDVDLDSVIDHIDIDKKANEGTNWVLLEKVGKPAIVQNVSQDALTTALERLCP